MHYFLNTSQDSFRSLHCISTQNMSSSQGNPQTLECIYVCLKAEVNIDKKGTQESNTIFSISKRDQLILPPSGMLSWYSIVFDSGQLQMTLKFVSKYSADTCRISSVVSILESVTSCSKTRFCKRTTISFFQRVNKCKQK